MVESRLYVFGAGLKREPRFTQRLRHFSETRVRNLLQDVTGDRTHAGGFSANHVSGLKLIPERINVDLPPFLTQPVKTQNPFKGELSHGVVETDVHQGVQAGRGPAAGAGGFHRRGSPGAGSEPERAAPLAA